MNAKTAAKTTTAIAIVQTNVTAADAARQRIRAWEEQARAAFPERDSVIRALLVCLVSCSNVILYGPPGTAKSMLARAFSNAFNGRFFDVLMTRFTTPSELFGALDIQAMKQGRLRRVVRGFLPEAHVAFLDEGFKANSACLNSLLTAVNEHAFHDDGSKSDIPLRTAVLASNEFPEDDDSLNAFDDRFPMRFDIKPLQNSRNLRDLLTGSLPSIDTSFTLDDVDTIRAVADSLPVTDDVIDSLIAIRAKLGAKGIYASDRKLATSVRLLRASAALTGSPAVSAIHLGLLENVLWLRPDQHATVREIVREHVATWLTDLRSAIEVIDQQDAAMSQAIRSTGNVGSTGALVAKAVQKLKELESTVLLPLAQEPEAASEVSLLIGRIEAIVRRGRDAMTKLW